MKRDVFLEKFEKASTTVWKDDLYKELIRTLDPNDIQGNGSRNLIIVMEELAELTQQLSKFLRGKRDNIGLIEETADVYMSLEYVKYICGISEVDINKAINVKLDRLKNTENIYL